MPLPLIIPVALAGIGVVAYVVTRKKDEPIPGGGPANGPTMSPQMRAAFQALLSGSDPDAMEQSAAALEPFGFLAEAGQLRTQAAALRKARLGGVAAPAPFLPQPQLASLNANAPGAPRATGLIPDAPAPPAPPAPTVMELDASNNIVSPAPAAQTVSAPAVSLPSFAVVTTSDPPPTGDLMIRPAPDAPGTPGVGAEKNGIVTVLKQDVRGDGVWSEIIWAGGTRLGPAQGFVKSKFLRPSAVGPQGTAIAGDSQVRCVAPSGCRLRRGPSTVSAFRAIVGCGETVKVLRVVQGKKLESFSPGKGGWAQVKYKSLTGWLPLEWLVKS